ncbi:hypothetical protein Q1695_009527 [Nippostrongylus brasiliensis]|nr:hypothetical protein Q1695_009527 [Nippostrongylus brasiliensis]
MKDDSAAPSSYYATDCASPPHVPPKKKVPIRATVAKSIDEECVREKRRTRRNRRRNNKVNSKEYKVTSKESKDSNSHSSREHENLSKEQSAEKKSSEQVEGPSQEKIVSYPARSKEGSAEKIEGQAFKQISRPARSKEGSAEKIEAQTSKQISHPPRSKEGSAEVVEGQASKQRITSNERASKGPAHTKRKKHHGDGAAHGRKCSTITTRALMDLRRWRITTETDQTRMRNKIVTTCFIKIHLPHQFYRNIN